MHFGLLDFDGTYLESLQLREGNKEVCLSGQAVNYDALASFVQAFEKDTDFFPEGPVLEDACIKDKNQGISFKLTLRL